MWRRALGLGGVVLFVLTGSAWWWTRVTPPVTEAEARAYLNRIVAAAQAQDFDTLCRLNGSVNICSRTLDEFNLRNAVPSVPPTVVGSRYSPKRGTGDTAGMILVVEGPNACGKPYHTEVFVFRENRYHFKAINAVYWSNARVVEDNISQPAGTPPPRCD